MDYIELRKKYPRFEYSKYYYQLVNGELLINFEYNISKKIYFLHKVVFDVDKKHWNKTHSLELSNLVFHLGLAEMFSYWKATCSPLIDVSAGYLSEKQIIWWKDLLINGMSQYFYENKIDFTPDNFVNMTSSKKETKSDLVQVDGEKTLIPVGGGKDSLVTLETLVRNDLGHAALVVHPTTFYSTKIIEKSGIKEVISVSRGLDPEILNLNSQGFLNGHIPYTNLLFFISLITAYIKGYKYIAFSNEKSADEVNIKYLGKNINHQYSKTFEFENDLRSYNRKYLSDINLFSFLRPLYDIQIAKIFSKYEKYFEIVRSCNVGQQAGVWCCNCPKCLSSFILLFPFIGPTKIKKLFPHNLYEDGHLSRLLDDLISEKKVKPFECVGTREELKVGLLLSLKHYHNNELPKLLKYAKITYLTNKKDLGSKTKKVLNKWDNNNNLPEKFSELLRKET